MLNQNQLFAKYFKGELSYAQIMEQCSKIWLDVNWYNCQPCATLRPENQVQEGKCIYCGSLTVMKYSAIPYDTHLWGWYQAERQRVEAEQRAFWAKLSRFESCVYFIQIVDLEETIKIGVTTNLKNRLRQLEYIYGKVRLLAVIEGDQKKEAAIHKTFATLRAFPNLGRELFLLKEPILDFIESSCDKVDYVGKMW